MSEQRREGDNLQRLLNDVQEEFGPRVQIVSASKARVGGVLGFFAKQQYVVVVRAPAGAPSDAGALVPRNDPADPAIAAARAAKMWGDGAAIAPVPAASPQVVRLPPLAPRAQVAPVAPAAPTTVWDEPEAEQQQRQAADVLARVATFAAQDRSAGLPAPLPAFSAAPPEDLPAAEPARESASVQSAPTPVPHPVPAPGPEPTPAPITSAERSTPEQDFAAALAHAVETIEAVEPAEPAEPAESAAACGVQPAIFDRVERIDSIHPPVRRELPALIRRPAAIEPPVPVEPPAPLERETARVPVIEAEAVTDLRTNSADIRVTPTDIRTVAAAQAPRGPGARPMPGDVVAVIGDLNVIFPEATALMRRWKMPTDTVTKAGLRQAMKTSGALVVTGPTPGVLPAEGPDQARWKNWRQAAVPVIVLVPTAPLLHASSRQLERQLVALGADQVLAAIDASEQAQALREWLGRFPGVQGLLAHHLGAAQTPTDIAGLGLPVVALDGRAATAARWRTYFTGEPAVACSAKKSGSTSGTTTRKHTKRRVGAA